MMFTLIQKAEARRGLCFVGRPEERAAQAATHLAEECLGRVGWLKNTTFIMRGLPGVRSTLEQLYLPQIAKREEVCLELLRRLDTWGVGGQDGLDPGDVWAVIVELEESLADYQSAVKALRARAERELVDENVKGRVGRGVLALTSRL